jgi:hypothetical protein
MVVALDYRPSLRSSRPVRNARSSPTTRAAVGSQCIAASSSAAPPTVNVPPGSSPPTFWCLRAPLAQPTGRSVPYRPAAGAIAGFLGPAASSCAASAAPKQRVSKVLASEGSTSPAGRRVSPCRSPGRRSLTRRNSRPRPGARSRSTVSSRSTTSYASTSPTLIQHRGQGCRSRRFVAWPCIRRSRYPPGRRSRGCPANPAPGASRTVSRGRHCAPQLTLGLVGRGR